MCSFVDTSIAAARYGAEWYTSGMIESNRPHTNLAQRLVFTVTRYQQYLTKHLKEFNLGLSEYPVLIYLVHRDTPDAKVSQSDVAQRQYRDPALITRAAKSLAGKGLIDIQSDPSNRARHILTLTAKGREVAHKVDDMVWEWEEQAFSDLSIEERKQLKQLLARLTLPE